MRYCITGGSGFIGGYFCRELTRNNHQVTILDLIRPSSKVPHDRYVKGDIRDIDACIDAMRDCQGVVNLAAAHHDFGIEEATYYSVNETGSQVICDAMDHHGIADCTFYSTVAVYGDAPEPHHEHSPTAPNTPYGGSKLKGEQVFKRWTEKGGGRRCLVIRPTVTFGPYNFANMYSLIRQIHRKRFVQVGPGRNIKSLSYVENILALTIYLWGKSGRPAFDLYNFIDKPDLTSRQISESIYDALDWRFPRWSVPMWLARLGALPFDIVIALTGKNLPISGARVKKLFTTQTKFEADRVQESGFETDVSVREGIRRMVQWYLKEGRYQSAEWHQPPAEVVSTPSKAAATAG